ncbi:MAG: septal ring lytic transglycosylase RlpA family protein [Bacteroidota bacterium]|nr:septal ring lytic transglycosylase RlpA family protein [Bacteroidota bacterium]MDP4229330.1 septal ring lytic transglycosylase RlpA family protein [Bacteroidota bacterium]MDP4236914.1 septal ring lytic transglycosylase RlpA family protein [Bacteroidota bacterium]
MIQAENIFSISKEAVKRSGDALKHLPKEVITAEEIVRHRIQTFLRVGLATVFFWLSSLISIGATALAQAATKDQPTKAKTTARHRHRAKTFRHSLDSNTVMIGTASWYGHKFHNRKTASGKRFDQDAFMAAHRSLPFGTLLRVTNIANNRSCIVEVTDRGPFVKNRIIDLSRRAARELGFADAGTAHVILQVIAPTDITSLQPGMRRYQGLSDVLKTSAIALQAPVPSN